MSRPDPTRRWRSLAALATAATLWGSNHVVTRAVRHELPVEALVFWRWVLALALLLPFSWRRLYAEAPLLRQYAGYVAGMGIVGVGIFSWAIHAAAYHAPAGEVGLLSSLTPVWALIIAAALGIQRTNAAQVAGVGCALVGAAIILTHGSGVPTLQAGGAMLGQLLALIAGLAFAWYVVRLPQRPVGLLASSFIAATAAAGTLLVALPVLVVDSALRGALPWPAGVAGVSAAGLGGLIYIAIGPTLVANLLWAYGTAGVSSSTAASFLYLMPVSASALSILFLGEELHPYHVVGVLAIFVGIALADRRPGRSPPPIAATD